MLSPHSSEDSITLSIGTLTGNIFHIDVYPDDTVYALKSKFHALSGIPPTHQHLIYQDTLLDDTLPISAYPVTSGTQLVLVVSMQDGIAPPPPPASPPPIAPVHASEPVEAAASPERPATAILITRLPHTVAGRLAVPVPPPRPHTTQIGTSGALIARCHHCAKRLRYTFRCKCTFVFCAAHRHRHVHACAVDEREEQKKRLRKLQGGGKKGGGG